MAQSSVVITIPGVLMKVVTSAPIPVGIQLYHALSAQFNVLLVTDDDKKETDHWLKVENLNKHGTVLYGEGISEAQGSKRYKQVSSLRSRGFSIDLVVEPDPKIAAQLLRGGFNVCNFLHSAYAYPAFRPDYEGEERRWEEIEQRVELDKLMRAEDKRLNPDTAMLT